MLKDANIHGTHFLQQRLADIAPARIPRSLRDLVHKCDGEEPYVPCLSLQTSWALYRENTAHIHVSSLESRTKRDNVQLFGNNTIRKQICTQREIKNGLSSGGKSTAFFSSLLSKGKFFPVLK
jgi:hypothetical protein